MYATKKSAVHVITVIKQLRVRILWYKVIFKKFLSIILLTRLKPLLRYIGDGKLNILVVKTYGFGRLDITASGRYAAAADDVSPSLSVNALLGYTLL